MEDALMVLALAMTGFFVAVGLIAGKMIAAKLFFHFVLFLFRAPLRIGALVIGALRGMAAMASLPLSSARVLMPGDRPPSPQGDYLDYRGLARENELRPLFGEGVSLGRYLLPTGRVGRELRLPLEVLQRNAAVVGPTGSGKTEGIMIPWILDLLRAHATVITVDVKGDLFNRLQPEAERLGVRLWYWNHADENRSQSWNWLHGIWDSRDVEASVRSIIGPPRENDPHRFFHERDYRWLRALIEISRRAFGRSVRPRDIYEMIVDQEHLRDMIRRNASAQEFSREVADILQAPIDEHSRAISGLVNHLHLFNTPEVIRFSERNDLHLADVASQPTLLIIGASLAHGQASEVLSGIMLSRLFNVIYRRLDGGSSTAGTPVYFLIDEAPRLRDRIKFEEVLSVVRSAQAGVCLAAQDVTQFGDNQRVTSILSNCLSLILLPGCSSESARYFSNRLGQRREKVLSRTQQRGSLDLLSQHGRTEQMQTVPVLGDREIMSRIGSLYHITAHVPSVSSKPFMAEIGR